MWGTLTRSVLSAECKETTLDALMATLFTMEDLLLRNAIRSKKKDFVRGRKIYEVGLKRTSSRSSTTTRTVTRRI